MKDKGWRANEGIHAGNSREVTRLKPEAFSWAIVRSGFGGAYNEI